MKFIHLSDLHIGKRVNEFSMLDDQKYILLEIIEIIEKQKPDFVLIAGDVYDKTQPSGEAVRLLDDFIFRLSSLKLPVFIISGNHDSAERIAFGARIMQSGNIFMSPVYDGNIEKHTLSDEWGNVNVFMLPFIKPVNVRQAFPDEEINSYTDAVSCALGHISLDESERNVILSHQFVTGAIKSDSEEISLGGTDNVDVCAYDKFDYVALGHIHSPQKLVRDTVRYCGTPLKYSFSECRHNKSVTVVEMKEKGDVEISLVPLIPKRDLVEIKGTYDELMQKSYWEKLNSKEDYFHITLTDEEDVVDAIGRLRTVYTNIMKIDYDNRRTQASGEIEKIENVKEKSPIEIFENLYEKQNASALNDEQTKLLKDIVKEVWEGEECDL